MNINDNDNSTSSRTSTNFNINIPSINPGTCETCIHRAVCLYTNTYKDYQDKISKIIDNKAPSIFRVSVICEYYRTEINTITYRDSQSQYLNLTGTTEASRGI